MHTPSPAAGNTPPRRARPRRRWLTWPPMRHAAPVAVIALYGAAWIAVHAGGGRGSPHTLWQSLALAETVLALLLRARKPAGALAGILAVYLLFDLDPLLLPAVLLALLTVADRRPRAAAVAAIATAAVTVATPYLHGDTVSFAGYSLPRLAAAGIAVAAGMCLRRRREIAGLRSCTVHPAGEPERCVQRTGSDTPGGPR
jgi:hypothetical protein